MMNNMFFPEWSLDPKLSVGRFRECGFSNSFITNATMDSPSRYLSNVFWESLPWEAIAGLLGDIHVMDIGCGSGAYADSFQKWSGGKVSSYHGVDIYKSNEWEERKKLNHWMEFTRIKKMSALEEVFLPETNLIVSQSALEHVKEDLQYFRSIKKYILERKKPVIQVHIVPSSHEFPWIYGMHGVRQYSPRTISMLTKICSPFSRSVVWRIGGRECNSLHRDFISRPIRRSGEDFRQKKPDEYFKKLKEAVIADSKSNDKSAAAYAFAVFSTHNDDVFSSLVSTAS